MFLRCFLYLSLVNLPLLASFEKKFTYSELDCFLEVENNCLEEDNLADEATRDVFALFSETVTLLAKEAVSCFWK